MTDADVEAVALLPCPFCGGDDVIARETHDGPVRPVEVICRECGAQSDIYDDADKAIAAWNRRAAIAADPGRKAMVEALERFHAAYESEDSQAHADLMNEANDLMLSALSRARGETPCLSRRETMHPSTYGYLKPTDDQLALMDKAREAAKVYGEALEALLPDGADKTFVIRAHRTNAMWCNVCITRHPDGTPRE